MLRTQSPLSGRRTRGKKGAVAGFSCHRVAGPRAFPDTEKCHDGTPPFNKTDMPTTETLERFIARVEQNAHAEACEEFHLPDSTMQENQDPPRTGRDAHVAFEHVVMSRAKSVQSTCVRPVLVQGDHVMIRWIFRFEWLDGSVTRIEEIACQRWEGERIAQETFFFDPAQKIPRKPAQ